MVCIDTRCGIVAHGVVLLDGSPVGELYDNICSS